MTARAPVRDLFAGMNGTEKKRAIELEALRRDGRIAGWWYERLTLKLASDLRVTLDFLIQENDGALRLEDTKGGFCREDARIKYRMAVEQFPFPIRVMSLQKSGTGYVWHVEEF